MAHNIRVVFGKIIVDSQSLGDDEHMVSIAFFTVYRDNEHEGTFAVNLKQTVGDSYETGAIEVGPNSYKGPLDHAAFSAAAEAHFRNEVGPSGSTFQVGPGVRIRDSVINSGTTEVTFTVEDSGGPW